ncbi:MAG: hypothetical protein ACRCT8_13840 [Lacipirellulaceae bacterium]
MTPSTPRRMSLSADAASTLEGRIRDRIASRLGSRVRNLTVCLTEGVIQIGGECSTYYSKQLAQHAALGLIEDEALDNAIVVTTPR